MTADVLAQACEPFFSTKPEGKGTGLGLSMVYGFVKQSGGHVKIYSEPGHGTTVKLYLPRTHDVEDVNVVPEAGSIVGGAETILVAEDDEQVRTIVVEMLTELGYRVLKANDAASALAIIDSGMPIDLLFTDVVMPGPLRSPELARKARERLPNIAVLFTSGYTENSIVHGGRLDTGVELLGKPYTREALARKIRHVLSNERQRAAVSAPRAYLVSAAHAVTPKEAAAAPRLSILYVEDDDLIRANTAELLEALGHSVHATGDGQTALDLLEHLSFDVLLTDVNLPGISGETLATRARAARPDLRVVFASGENHVSSVAGALTLLKPYNLKALEAMLKLVK
jgi:CheY-like chemotaxis protein